jgi:filamentous hemagglutinin family protein
LTKAAIRRCPRWRFEIALAFGIVGAIACTCKSSLAQITPDATLGAEGSVLTPNANVRGFPADLIEGGATRGANLFHSFSEFNVEDGLRVYFANPAGIENILTRVTGNTLSNILGTLGVNGTANLFLLNPNGIIFGPNARLDVGGSFMATTANSFVFGDGLEFSATNPTVPPLLTISVPLGLQYGPQPGAIASQGALLVDEGQSLILAGGDIALDNTFLAVDFFQGGRIELGAVGGEGTVGLKAEGTLLSLSFPDELQRANVSLANGSVVDVRAEDGGSIAIHAQNIDISMGSRLLAGIASGLGSPESQAGNIILDATGEISVDQSLIYNLIFPGATGTSGNIEVTTGSLAVTNRAQLSASTLGQGNAGSVIINARDNVSLDNSTIFSIVGEDAVGRGGNINITTGSLALTNVAQLDASPFGQGDGGDIIINARDTVSLDGSNPAGSRTTSIFTEVVQGARGNGGNIEISTGSLFVTNGAKLEASTRGVGDAGNTFITARDTVSFNGVNAVTPSGTFSDIEADAIGRGGNIQIATGSLEITNGAQLSANTNGWGNAGNIIIEARDRVSLDGFDEKLLGDADDFGIDGSGLLFGISPSLIRSDVDEGGNGSGGDIRITTGVLSITNGAEINANTAGQGSAGSIVIEASDRVFLGNIQTDSNSISPFPSSIRSAVEETGNGAGGDIRITTGSLSVTDGTRLVTSTDGRNEAGNDAGNIIIQARNAVSFEGESPDDADVTSSALSRVEVGAIGNGGNVEITASSLLVSDGSQLDATTFGQGDAGSVIINVRDAVTFTGINSSRTLASTAFSNVETGAAGRGGNVEITAGSLAVTNTAKLLAETAGQGDAGSVIINVRDFVVFDGDDTIADSGVREGAVGRGGNVEITAGSLAVTNTAKLLAETAGQGDAGDVIIEARDQVTLDNNASILSSVAETGDGIGGDIRIRAGSLFVNNGALLEASTSGQGDAGNIDIEARDSVTFTGTGRNDFGSNAYTGVELTGNGDGGNVRISTGSLFLSDNAALGSSTLGQGDAGDVIINARDRVSISSGIISSIVGSPLLAVGNGDGGDIRITTGSLSLTDGAQLQASTFGQGDAGDIIIEAQDNVSLTGVRRDGKSYSAAFSIVGLTGNGDGGNIRISSRSLSVTAGALLSTSTIGQGNAGSIQLAARDTVLLDGGNSRTGFSSGLFSSTFESAGGRGGTISVNTDSFRIVNGAIVDAQTFGAFRGGDVIINAQNLSLSDRAQISARSSGTGDAGRVEITATGAVRLTNSDITTSAEQAAGGAIAITTESLSLNRGRISAATGTSGAQGAANITLQGLDLLRMGNESLIEANALNQANGGNVTIDSTFIVATPPEGPEGSDITANAFQGNGGRVSINTQGVFGIEFRPQLTPDNDITVSSDFGIAGVFEQNTPGVDPSRGLAELPTDVVDASRQIDRRCTSGGVARNSSFTVTGRRGLPPSPNDTLQGESVITNWVSLNSELENNTSGASTTRSSSTPRQLVEAQGWVFNEKGEVVLTASSPTVTPHKSGFQELDCNAPPPENPPESESQKSKGKS